MTGFRNRPAEAADGVFVAVVGPSGVGKDALINYARASLQERSEFVFARRIVTRPPDGASEDHDSVGEAEFEALVRDERLALWWQAHGLSYGLPRSLETAIESGKVVIANVSRQALGHLGRRFRRICVVAVYAHPEVVAARLAARGREDAATIAQRRSRVVTEEFEGADVVRIENSGPLTIAGDRLVEVLQEVACKEIRSQPA